MILVTDDDEADHCLIASAMRESGVDTPIRFLENGQVLIDELLARLEPNADGEDHELPSLILLDLNMPVLDGRETLKFVKSHAKLREIPVVILSSSNNHDDVVSTYRDGANSFFTKPLEYRDLVDLMGLLKTYWFETAQLPS